MISARRSKRIAQFQVAIAAAGLFSVTQANATILFDNGTQGFSTNNFNPSAGAPSLAYTTRVGNTYEGDAYTLPTGAADIYGVDLFPFNATSLTFQYIEANLYIWGSVNTTGTVSPTAPAFSNLLGERTSFLNYGTGGLKPGYNGLEGGDTGSEPGGRVFTPIVLPSNTVGVTINYQGSNDGVNFSSVQNLTSLIPYNAPPAVGVPLFNGFYENQYNAGNGTPVGSQETNGNFISPLRTFVKSANDSTPLPNQTGPLLRLYGDVGVIAPDKWLSTAGGVWTDGSKWSNGAPPSPGIDAIFNLSSASSYTVEVPDVEYTANLRVGNDNVTLDLDNLNSYIGVLGTMAVGVPLTPGAATRGSLTLANTGGLTDSMNHPVITLAEPSSVVIGGNGGTGTLTTTTFLELYTDNDTAINAGSSLVVGSQSNFSSYTLTIAGSTNAWTGKLDVGNSDVVLRNASIGTVINQLKTGLGNGRWNGNGITSSAAAADTTHLMAVGVVLNNDGSGNPLFGSGNTSRGVFNGDVNQQSPGLNAVLLRYTYFGDANIDGKVDATDYSRIDNGFLMGLSGWYNGDFNYDGVVDGSDYTLIDNAFNRQGVNAITGMSPSSLSVLGSGQITQGEIAQFNDHALAVAVPFPVDNPTASVTSEIAGVAAVPEPASAGLIAVGAISVLGRRSRRRQFAANI